MILTLQQHDKSACVQSPQERTQQGTRRAQGTMMLLSWQQAFYVGERIRQLSINSR